MSDLEELSGPQEPPEEPPAAAAAPATDGNGRPTEWKPDKQGREYITLPNRRGPLYRRGDETIEERIARDGRPKDEKPTGRKSKTKPPKIAPPRDLDLRAIEAELAKAFASPAFIAGMAGDVFLAKHFTDWGPNLARSLVVTSESVPALRRQLEQIAAGGSVANQLMVTVGLAATFGVYIGVPIVYAFDVDVPFLRAMFHIPHRKAAENGAAAQGADAAGAAAPQAA